MKENVMFILLKKFGLYVAAVHVPSKARALLGTMAQVVQFEPAQGEVGR